MENKRLEKINSYQDSRDLPRFSTMIKARGGYYLLGPKGKVFYTNKKISKLCKLYVKPRYGSFSDFYRRNRTGFIPFPRMWNLITPEKDEVFIEGSERPDSFNHVISMDASVLYGNMPKMNLAPMPVIVDSYGSRVRGEIDHPMHHLGSGIGCVIPPIGVDAKWLEQKLKDSHSDLNEEYYRQNLFPNYNFNGYGLDLISKEDLELSNIDKTSWHEAQAKYNRLDYREVNMKMVIQEMAFDKLLNEKPVLPTLEDMEIKELPQPHINLGKSKQYQIATDRNFKNIVYDSTKEEDSFFKPVVIPKILK